MTVRDEYPMRKVNEKGGKWKTNSTMVQLVTDHAALYTAKSGVRNPESFTSGSDVRDGECVDNGGKRGAAMLKGKSRMESEKVY